MSSPDLSNLPSLSSSNLPVPEAVDSLIVDAKEQVVDPAVQTVNKTVQNALPPVQDLLQNDTFDQAVKALTTILEPGTGPESPVVLPPPDTPPVEGGNPAPPPSGSGALPGQTPNLTGQPAVAPQQNPENPLTQSADIPAQPLVIPGAPGGGEPNIPASLIAGQEPPASAQQIVQDTGSTPQAAVNQTPLASGEAPPKGGQDQMLQAATRILASLAETVYPGQDKAVVADIQKAFIQFVSNLTQTSGPRGGQPHFFDSGTLLATLILAGHSLDPAQSHKEVNGFKAALDTIEQAIRAVLATIPDGTKLVALLMGAILLATMVPYGAAPETLKEQGVNKGQELTLEFAKQFAARMIKLTTDPEYGDYLKALVWIHTQGKASPAEIDEHVNTIKVGLLLTALAVFYQAETGGMTSQEVVGYLHPDKEISPDDLKAPLVNHIKRYLALLQPQARENVLVAMMEYLDSKPNLKALTSPIAVVQGMQSSGAFGQNVLQAQLGA